MYIVKRLVMETNFSSDIKPLQKSCFGTSLIIPYLAELTESRKPGTSYHVDIHFAVLIKLLRSFIFLHETFFKPF